jgi:hypothetical protein
VRVQAAAVNDFDELRQLITHDVDREAPSQVDA